MNEEFILPFIVNNMNDIDILLYKRTKLGVVFKSSYKLINKVNIPYLCFLIEKKINLNNIYLFDILSNAIILRQLGIKKKIILLYYISPENVQLAIDNDIEVTCPNIDWLNLVIHKEKIDTSKNKLKLHIYFDSNLGREGINNEEQLYLLLKEINKYKNIEIVGLGTKFNSEIENTNIINLRYINKDIGKKLLIDSISPLVNKFKSIIKYSHENNLINKNTKIHAACSSEVYINYEETFFDFVRIGSLAFKTILNMFYNKTFVLDIKSIPINTCVGYFCKQKTNKDIIVGYIINYRLPNCIYKYNNILLNPVNTLIPYNPYLLDVTFFKDIKIGDSIEVFSDNII